MNKQKARTQRGAVMMEYVILVMMLALALFAGNNYLTNDSWLEDKLFVDQATGAGPPTLGKDVAGMYQRVMAGICLPTP
jgi:Flp pilus assembly pilin Flp